MITITISGSTVTFEDGQWGSDDPVILRAVQALARSVGSTDVVTGYHPDPEYETAYRVADMLGGRITGDDRPQEPDAADYIY